MVAQLEPMAITMAEASKVSGIGRKELTRIACTDRTFPAFKRGNKVLVFVEGLKKYLERKATRRDGFAEFSE